MRIFVALILFLTSLISFAQPKTYSTSNAHSHNDYENVLPFYLAFQNDFGSIEADIYAVNDTLFVAHNKQDIKPGRTLKSLYLDPLKQALDSNRNRSLKLLIDIKDDYSVTLPLLVKELNSLKEYLSTQDKKRSVTIVISGNRPPPYELKIYPDFIFFDDDLRRVFTKDEWQRVALVSLPLTRITRWNGKDNISTEDSMNIKRTIDSVHAAGKPIRFWAAPDTELSWQLQMNVGVDLIGTDKIKELAAFLHTKRKK